MKNPSPSDRLFVVECQKTRTTRSLSSRLERNKLLSECHEHHLLLAPRRRCLPFIEALSFSYGCFIYFFFYLYLYLFLFFFCRFFSGVEEVGEFFAPCFSWGRLIPSGLRFVHQDTVNGGTILTHPEREQCATECSSPIGGEGGRKEWTLSTRSVDDSPRSGQIVADWNLSKIHSPECTESRRKINKTKKEGRKVQNCKKKIE